MTIINCDDKTCKWNKYYICQKDTITVGCDDYDMYSSDHECFGFEVTDEIRKEIKKIRKEIEKIRKEIMESCESK